MENKKQYKEPAVEVVELKSSYFLHCGSKPGGESYAPPLDDVIVFDMVTE